MDCIILSIPMLNVKEIDSGVEFNVLAKPKAGRNEISGFHDGAVRISVTAVPEKGKANSAIIKILTKVLKVPASNISILSGDTSRQKRVRIENLTKEILLNALQEAVK
jgi:uncharacterized protein